MRISDWSSDVCSSDLEASAIDVVANITNLRSTCDDSGPQLYTNATFDVLARRSDANGARDVTLPYFATVVRGGTAVVSKRVGPVNIHFADGEYRASASGTAHSYVLRGQATLPCDIPERITPETQAGDHHAALLPTP